jgi:hypothetical protein
MANLEDHAGAPYPGAGTLRVHPDPAWLPQPPNDPSTPGSNRFDDPYGQVAARYTATRLQGCLYETMARFRPSPTAEAMLQSIDGIEAADVDWPEDDDTAIADWLERQQIGTVRVLDTGVFANVEEPDLLVQLDKHPLVRTAVQDLDPAGRLDTGLIRLGGLRLGRPISQAVGAAIREWMPHALGIAYTSRLADEPCWAIWATTHVDITSVHLDPSEPLHREAVRRVARTFEIALPSSW